ncbi:Pro-Pol polyprotein [Nosema granulosis]|uniref:Pro-Pol polyprotein n=1 Tax=Nosema granulosis TaxID=83296 RepID=A0A9P6GWF5_9MICR|nr:Pro-Pol polyprotein [Nosema granulosis]
MLSRCLVLKTTKQKCLTEKILNLEAISEAQAKSANINHNTPSITIGKFKLATDDQNKIIIPPEIETSTLIKCHRRLGHTGRSKLFNTLNKTLDIKGLREKINKITENCKQCQMEKNLPSKQGKLSGSISAETPFQKLAIDLYGPISERHFKGGEDNNKIMLLVIVDVYSRITDIIPTTSISTRAMQKCLTQKWFKKYGKTRRNNIGSRKTIHCSGIPKILAES